MLRKLVSLMLVTVMFLALAAPAHAWSRAHGGAFHGGGFRGGGFHGGFHHHGFHRFGCCFGPAFVGGVFLGASLAAPYYYPYAYSYPYPTYAGPAYSPAPTYQAYAAPQVTREVCYTGGCYHLQGDGVTAAYQWVWIPAVPAPPTGPPNG
jgi:hypothetical protein